MTDELKRVPCPCTLVQQDETCPVGYPSLLCDACDGRGVVYPASAIAALRAENERLRDKLVEAGYRREGLTWKALEHGLNHRSAEARLAEAVKVMEPFADCASEWNGEADSLHVFFEWNDEGKPVPSLPVADFRAARAWYEKEKSNG